jgi:hypothetical protein
MPSNLVHTYVLGSFPNIYGGASETAVGYISHIVHMTPLMEERWPWMKDKWLLDDGRYYKVYYDTLREAVAAAKVKWPGHELKTRKQFAKEAVESKKARVA